MLRKLSLFHLLFQKTLVLLIWKWISLSLTKSRLFMMLVYCLILLNWVWIITLSQFPKRSLENLNLELTKLSMFFAINIPSCMIYFCHVQVGPPNWYLHVLDRFLRLLVLYLMLLSNHWTIFKNMSNQFERRSSGWVDLVSLCCSCARWSLYSDSLHNFSFTIPTYLVIIFCKFTMI